MRLFHVVWQCRPALGCRRSVSNVVTKSKRRSVVVYKSWVVSGSYGCTYCSSLHRPWRHGLAPVLHRPARALSHWHKVLIKQLSQQRQGYCEDGHTQSQCRWCLHQPRAPTSEWNNKFRHWQCLLGTGLEKREDIEVLKKTAWRDK